MVEDEKLRTAQIAERLGITSSTWSSYVTRGQAPKPDGHYDGRTPWWLASTVEAWHASRPGRGVRRAED